MLIARFVLLFLMCFLFCRTSVLVRIVKDGGGAGGMERIGGGTFGGKRVRRDDNRGGPGILGGGKPPGCGKAGDVGGIAERIGGAPYLNGLSP